MTADGVDAGGDIRPREPARDQLLDGVPGQTSCFTEHRVGVVLCRIRLEQEQP
ncbi:MAG TPA: hypothetical protein VI072_10590 [Polyangiaceae bacterium]